MKNDISRTVRTLLVFGTAAFLASLAVAQDVMCDGDPQDISVKIKVKDNKASEVVKGTENADELHACPGDTIEWKTQGKNFEINFPDKTPLDARTKNSSNHKLTATIRDDAESDSYKYSITIDGGETWDPRVVVDR